MCAKKRAKLALRQLFQSARMAPRLWGSRREQCSRRLDSPILFLYNSFQRKQWLVPNHFMQDGFERKTQNKKENFKKLRSFSQSELQWQILMFWQYFLYIKCNTRPLGLSFIFLKHVEWPNFGLKTKFRPFRVKHFGVAELWIVYPKFGHPVFNK